MFLLPLGLLGGADLSIADTIVKNFVPTTIGNAIAGAVVVAASYSYQFGTSSATPPSSRAPRRKT
jgi:formate/nitrite transporter FocA (FNT family)